MTERLDYLSDQHLAEVRAHRLHLFIQACAALDIARHKPALLARPVDELTRLERTRNDAHLAFEAAALEVERRYIDNYPKDNQP